MIDLYYWPTPNGWKITIMLEECGIPYTIKYVDISKGEQFDLPFLKISPNNRIPAIYDHDTSISVFESGAILQYLAEKTGMFLPSEMAAKFKTLEWLNWQMGGLGPMLGQVSHFTNYASQLTDKDFSYSLNRYKQEGKRLYGVMDKKLSQSPFLAGDYSIADIASFPWIISWKHFDYDLVDFPNLKRWFFEINARSAVEKSINIGIDLRKTQPKLDDKAKEKLFNAE